MTSLSKSPIVHVDLIDSDGHMTITTNITNQLIDKFMTKLFPGASVRIKDFFMKKRHSMKEVTSILVHKHLLKPLTRSATNKN